MTPITLVKMQSLEHVLGTYSAARFCAPLAFYMLLKAHSYIPKQQAAVSFCRQLDDIDLKTESVDWSRPALSRQLRRTYGAKIVSWSFHYPKPDYAQMKKAGYIEDAAELKFFKQQILGKSVEDIVRAGHPVIVTMKPGFGSDENRNIHAVVVSGWGDDYVTVHDPDARNPRSRFEPEYVRRYISPAGAGSVVLPK